MNENQLDPFEEISRGAWTRLRNLIGTLDRVDRLETSSEYVGWLQRLAADQNALAETMREFLLRCLRLAADPISWSILEALREKPASTTADLVDLTGLQRVEIVERLNELARAGLTVQPLDADRVEATELARGLLLLVSIVSARMFELAAEDYLLKPRPPIAKPENRIASAKAQ